MTNINYPYISNYINETYPDHKPTLKAIEDYARENSIPIMERESLELLKTIIKLSRPKRVLELGTAIGYSSIAMALTSDELSIDTMDRDGDLVDQARENIEKLSLEDRINIIFGEIEDGLDDLDGIYDLIVFDAGKSHYGEYFQKCERLMENGTILFSDNVLFKGLIANDDLVKRRNRTITRNMREYLYFLTNSAGIATSILPVGDGVALTLIEEKDKWKE